MPIDKIIPRKLVADKDQRLLEEGSMTDALNVSVTENGEGSEGVLKNVLGTTFVGPLDPSDQTPVDLTQEVIGSAVDNQRAFIYFFVWAETASYNTIYQYDANENRYRIVFRGSFLNFDRESFVKADVVNSNFQQDDVLQSILYFTDNINPPRKINVDRAIAGGYNGITNANLDYALNAIKAAPVREPKTVFSTDEDLLINNFRNNTFQFATQFIYTDGEESALSPFSKLASPDINSVAGLESIGFGKNFYQDNICEIQTRYRAGSNTSPLADSITLPDVKKVRVLARRGNDGNFFIIDEYNPYQAITRNILGVDVEVYNPSTGVYKFYNEGAYAGIPEIEYAKLYDNVPFKARAQSYSGNRVFYGNYEEGRPNVDVRANISVLYSQDKSVSSGLDAVNAGSQVNTDDNPNIQLDFLAAGAFTSESEIVPAGSRTRIRLDYHPNGSVAPTGSDDYVYVVNAFDSNNNSVSFGVAQVGFVFDFVIDIIYENETDQTVEQIVDAIELLIQDRLYDIDIPVAGSGGMGYVVPVQVFESSSPNFVDGSTINFDTGGNINVSVSLSDTVQTDSTTLLIKPRISSYRFDSVLDDDIVTPNVTISSDEFYGGAAQSSLDYYVVNDYLDVLEFSSTAFALDPSFKSGSFHDFGVVYYDKYNRSGNVNKIGSAYVKAFPERNADEYGPAAINISITSDPPDWADRFQIVYSGMSSFSNFTTYTTGGAYPARTQDGTNSTPIDTGKKLIYVSLNTLESFKDEKSALRDYSFTEGDVARVISYDSATGSDSPNIVYPTASDGSLIEFNVVGVELFTHGNSKLYEDAHDVTHDLEHEHEGLFLVLEANSVNTGVNGTDGNDIKFTGFDWHSIANQQYPDGTASPNVNHWGKRTVLEILTPSKTVSDKVYYEIGESQAIGIRRTGTYPSTHGPAITTRYGDVYFRPIAAKTPYRDPEIHTYHSGTAAYDWSTDYRDRWRYENVIMESHSLSDFFPSRDWSRGRSHVVFENSATVRRYNGMVFSDGYTSDVSRLALSSFNPSQANFFDLDSRYGDLNYLATDGESSMIGLQENKMSLIPINKNILGYSGGNEGPVVSTDVVQDARYAAGDYGCGNNPESVLVVDGKVYFFDKSRQAVLRYGGNGLEPISEIDISSLIEDEVTAMNAGATRYKIISGYDPQDNIYYITFRPSGDYAGNTYGFDESRRFWQSRYSFNPYAYAHIDNKFMSCYRNILSEDRELFHVHNNQLRNVFYGGLETRDEPNVSYIRIVSKISPSDVKVFNAISHEGNSNSWVSNSILTNLNKQGTATVFDEREASYYSYISRDTISSTKHIVGLAYATGYSLAPPSIQLDRNINRIPLPIGAVIYYEDPDGNIELVGGTPEGSTLTGFLDINRIRVNSVAVTDIVGRRILAYLSSQVDGDPIRGHWAEITMTSTGTNPIELYCVNTHFAISHQHHAR